MDANFYFDLLNTLNNAGINEFVYVNGLFPLLNNEQIALITTAGRVEAYLKRMEKNGHIMYARTDERGYENGEDREILVEVKFHALLTSSGYEYLQQEAKRKEDATLNSTMINTNISIAKNSKRQTLVLIATLIFSAISLIISYWNYTATKTLKTSEQQILILEEHKPTLIKSSKNNFDTLKLKGVKTTSVHK